MNKKRFPPWVDSNHIVMGDVCYQQEYGKWEKYYFTGRQWINESMAPVSLKRMSNKRMNHMRHVEQVRKS